MRKNSRGSFIIHVLAIIGNGRIEINFCSKIKMAATPVARLVTAVSLHQLCRTDQDENDDSRLNYN